MRTCTVLFHPVGKRQSVRRGTMLLEAASLAGLTLQTACGGKGTCQKCQVLIGRDRCPVLACQFSVERDVEVTIPQATEASDHRILLSGAGQSVEVCPTIQPSSPNQPVYGIACDIGTTTVVARLMDLKTGGVLATAATINPQSRHGFDVVSRIHYGSTEHGLKELHRLIVDGINDLIADLCQQTGVDRDQIHELCVVGNTTMNHLFLGLPVTQLGQAPYAAFSVDAHDMPAADLRIRIHAAGNVHAVENIAGFVGADTTAVAVAVDIDKADRTTLVLDIGTNGELLLAAGGKVYAASCAAGPAFEGARIRCGSRAVKGAIDRVTLLPQDIEISVIGGVQPRSICGSGLVDAVAVLLDLGLLDATGRLAGPARVPGGLPEAIIARVLEVEGQPAVGLAQDPESRTPAVVVTQADIRQVQLAKAAIRAGIELLLRRTGLASRDIEQVVLAGAFGNGIRPEGAVRIGLLPDVPPDHVRSVGNAACTGAEMILINRHCRAHAGRLARWIEYIEIARDPGFEQTYAEAMSFPARTGLERL